MDGVALGGFAIRRGVRGGVTGWRQVGGCIQNGSVLS